MADHHNSKRENTKKKIALTNDIRSLQTLEDEGNQDVANMWRYNYF
jgi:hypothetical protein